jgi:hypothetical protein
MPEVDGNGDSFLGGLGENGFGHPLSTTSSSTVTTGRGLTAST